MNKVWPILRGLGIYVLFLVLPVALMILVQLVAPQAAEAALWVLENFSSLITVLFLLLLYRLAGVRCRDAVGWKPENVKISDHGAAFGLGICGNVAISAVLNLLPASWLESYGEQSAQVLGNSMLMNVITVVLIAPVCEEILFRGMIFGSYRQVLPFVWAGGLSALLFGAAHVHPLWVCYAFLMGFCFSVMVERKGSISISIAAHIGFNLMSLAVVVIPYSAFLTWVFYGGILQLIFWGVIAAVGAVWIWKKWFTR